MSDGMTEAARDRLRGKSMNSFYERLVNYLEEPSQEKFDSLKNSAKDTDEINGGYFSSKTNIIGKLERKLQELKDGDKTSWAKILIQIYKQRFEPGIYESGAYLRLKKLSPYADKILIHVNYGRGFSNIDRTMEFQDVIGDKIESSKMKVMDADEYILAFDKGDFERLVANASVDWIYGVNGPRKKD